MVTDQLIAYIKQQTQQGVPPENIKATLRSNGWEDTDINQAFKSLNMSNFSATPISPIYVNLPLKPSAKNKYEDKKIVRPHKSSSWLFNTVAILVVVAGVVFGLHLAFPEYTTKIIGPTSDENLAAQGEEGTQTTSTGEAKKTYLTIREELDQTKNFSEFQALALKYGSKKQVAQIKANEQEVRSYPQEFLQKLFERAKATSPSSSEIVSVQEVIRNNTATLKITTTKSGVEGSAIMILENGSWKLDFESWTGYGVN